MGQLEGSCGKEKEKCVSVKNCVLIKHTPVIHLILTFPCLKLFLNNAFIVYIGQTLVIWFYLLPFSYFQLIISIFFLWVFFQANGYQPTSLIECIQMFKVFIFQCPGMIYYASHNFTHLYKIILLFFTLLVEVWNGSL